MALWSDGSFVSLVYLLRVVDVPAIIVKYIVEHLFCMHRRRVGIKTDGFEVAVDGVLEIALAAVFVPKLIIFVCGHFACSV